MGEQSDRGHTETVSITNFQNNVGHGWDFVWG